MDRVGIEVINKKLEIGKIRNKWLQHELDLSSLIPENEKGLFLVRLNFTKKDTLYRAVSSRSSNRYDYYSNPRNNGYYYRHGTVYKPVVISDIGLTYKKSDEKHIIYVNDVLTTKPLNNCQVILRTYQNQVITEGYTNSEGNIEFPITKENVFFIQALYKGQQSIVKLNEMAWNLSTFDVEGVSDITKGTRSFIYTERGVYRPGDEINISMIFRNQDNTFPENHPVQVEIFNPQNQKILERILKDGKDGFYHFSYTTQPTDMTGKLLLNA
jgi:uncharacterized protein YfaS (alpha-2-macroglobulin family)